MKQRESPLAPRAREELSAGTELVGSGIYKMFPLLISR